MAASLDIRAAIDSRAKWLDDDIDVEYQGDAQSVTDDMWEEADKHGLVLPCGLMQNVDADCGIIEQASGQVVDKTNLRVDWVIVSRDKARNRNGNMVQIKEGGGYVGLDVTQHIRNPIVLFNHGFPDPNPIAVTKTPDSNRYTVKKQARRAVASTYFVRRRSEDPESETERDFITQTAETTFALIEAGAMNANSISYLPILARRLSDKDLPKADEGVQQMLWWGGWDYVHAELLEDSIVPIGADRESLRQFVDRGSVYDAPIRGDYLKVLQAFIGPQAASMGYHKNRESINMGGVNSQELTTGSTGSDFVTIDIELPNGAKANIIGGAADVQSVVGSIVGVGTQKPTEQQSIEPVASEPVQVEQQNVDDIADQIVDQLVERLTPVQQGVDLATEDFIARTVAQAFGPVADSMKQTVEHVQSASQKLGEAAKRRSGQF